MKIQPAPWRSWMRESYLPGRGLLREGNCRAANADPKKYVGERQESPREETSRSPVSAPSSSKFDRVPRAIYGQMEEFAA